MGNKTPPVSMLLARWNVQDRAGRLARCGPGFRWRPAWYNGPRTRGGLETSPRKVGDCLSGLEGKRSKGGCHASEPGQTCSQGGAAVSGNVVVAGQYHGSAVS